MLNFLEKKGTEVCQNLYDYAQKWKQSINVKKTVVQLFRSQVVLSKIHIYMDGNELQCVKSFEYLGFEWTDKLSLSPTANNCMENIKNSYIKLRWLKRNKKISTEVLKKCFYAYSFPFFAWLFPFFPLLQKSHQKILRRKFRVGLRIIHRSPFIAAHEIPLTLKERQLDSYVTSDLHKRLKRVYCTDLGESLFYNDLFHWTCFKNKEEKSCDKQKDKAQQKLNIGHFFRLARVKKMTERHESYRICWLQFIENHPVKGED
jgi:hypothetical protein